MSHDVQSPVEIMEDLWHEPKLGVWAAVEWFQCSSSQWDDVRHLYEGWRVLKSDESLVFLPLVTVYRIVLNRD